MRIYNRNEVGKLTFHTLNASGGVDFIYDEADEKTIFVAKNSHSGSKDITVVKGNGLHGVVDVKLTVPAQSEVVFTLDSALFKNDSGAKKGKIVLKGDAELSVAIIALP